VDEPRIAFVVEGHEQPGIEILVNFGVFAGRQATPAEIDELARWLLDEVDDMTIVAEERHAIDAAVEASVQQVRIELPADLVPAGAAERRQLAERLVERAEHWARSCVAERGLL
jgi:hypothetical protein